MCSLIIKSNIHLMTSNTYLHQSFDKDFCDHLEYHLSRTLRNSSNNKIKWLWCDGVMQPLNEPNKNSINSSQIITEAYIGVDGQSIYQMTIKLGALSLQKYISGQDLIDTLPSEESLNWIFLDLDSKTIQIQLK